METHCNYLSYKQTGFFSKLVIDYLNGSENLLPFYQYPVSKEGVVKAIEDRKDAPDNRQLLVECLRNQYKDIELTAVQQTNLYALLKPTTYTITTAHQPNIFTGHLYFIYKILHTIKLAGQLNQQMPANHFVPVFYMGSEDADLDELGHVVVDGTKYTWNTKQTGAVGRMIVDKELVEIIDSISGRVGVYEHGGELTAMFKKAYKPGSTIQQATLLLVNDLFSHYGLLVLIPDDAALKRPFNIIVKKELETQFSHRIVEDTTSRLSKHYKPQASGREINLFYLFEDKRERIEQEGDQFVVKKLSLSWANLAIMKEVDEHPERFSANVILRGVFQEMILPNIAFIGGGGELAYWLELKEVFKACQVPFPMLILRNSFLLMNEKEELTAEKLRLTTVDLFAKEFDLVNNLVRRDTEAQLSLEKQKIELNEVYSQLRRMVTSIDGTLVAHIEGLQKKASKALVTVEKKMLRAERKKFEAQQRKIAAIKSKLFPNNNLQERVENMAEWYAKFGTEWIATLLTHSLTLEQQFGVVVFNSEANG